MKIIISSSRTMIKSSDYSNNLPILLAKSKYILKKLKEKKLEELVDIWDTKIDKAKDYYSELLKLDLLDNTTSAIKSFDGVVYRQFNDLVNNDDGYIDNNLLIISALYGLLKPHDGIRNYRLEMASKLKVDGLSLYQYWGDSIYDSINDKSIINLASEEYGKCIRQYIKEDDKLIDIDFIEIINNKERRISTNVKKARGQMIRYMIINKIDDVDKIKEFDYEGYHYVDNLSNDNKLVFLRKV